MKRKTIHLQRPCYTLDMTGKDAVLTMYGEIVETRPLDFWTGEPVEGEFIVLQDFLNDLETLKDAETLTIHMNSVGGDGQCAIAIHNRLRQLPATKTCIVDGVAMSGGSLIMCACDHTVVYPSSIVMWHHAWTYLWDAFNAPELHKMAGHLESIDASQAEIYARKTGKSIDECSAIMDEERYLTGREAFERGLADELADDADDTDIAVSADKRTLYVRGHSLRIAAMGTLPDCIKVKAANGCGDNKTPVASGTTGGNTMPTTLDELRAENPELADALLADAQAKATEAANTAAAAERKRLADIDAIASLFDADTVKAAKYDDPCTAEQMAYRAATKAVQQGKAFMADLNADSAESGANDVPTAHASDIETAMTDNDMLAAGKAAAMRMQGKATN